MKKEKLHNINNTGFKTPKDYFETFDERLMLQIEDKKSIDGIKNTGFTIPENYFESIDTKILNKISEDNKPKVISLFSRKRLYYISGIAASIVLLFSLFINNQNKLSIEAIDVAAIESYLYQQEYSNDEFASLFKSNTPSETDFINVDISEETLIEYLEESDNEELILD